MNGVSTAGKRQKKSVSEISDRLAEGDFAQVHVRQRTPQVIFLPPAPSIEM